jgi:hypothetical protein
VVYTVGTEKEFEFDSYYEWKFEAQVVTMLEEVRSGHQEKSREEILKMFLRICEVVDMMSSAVTEESLEIYAEQVNKQDETMLNE